jgi:hypothetical protein
MSKAHRNIHHRCPLCLGGKNHPRNLSNVSITQHQSWHNLFGGRKPQDIADFINAVWIDPDYKFICVKLKPEENKKQLHLNL